MKAALAAIFCSLILARPADAREVTFHRDVAPIVYANCASCHHEGGAGPFPLTSYFDVKKHARQIVEVTRSRIMPPWLPQAGYGDFANPAVLSAEQIQTIQEWVNQGAMEGDSSVGPKTPVFASGWQLGTPDLVVEAPKAFTTPAEGRDVFWNFILTPPVDRTRYVRAVEIRPGAARLVHHANLLIDRTRSARVQEKNPGEGFAGMDLSIENAVSDPESHFLFWKPGSVPVPEPEGRQWRLDPGNDLILNVHFQPSGKPESVRPSIGLYFTDRPPTTFPILIQLEHDGALDIPAGDASFRVADDFRLPLDVQVLAVYPHAHYLGKVLEGYATLPDGTKKWLIRIPDWDLNRQSVFRYREPVSLPKGSVVSMRYQYDNSSANPRNPNHPPKRVQGGNQSTDEMGHLWLQVLPAGQEDRRGLLEEALMRHRLKKYSGDFSAQFNLGGLLLKRRETDAAISYLRAALEVQPDHPVALNTLGAALETRGKLDEAMEEYRHALRIEPGYWNARYNLANALASQGKMDEAIDDFEEVVKANPADPAAREHLEAALEESASSFASAGNLPKAAERMQRLVDLRPGDANLRNSLGTLLARSGNMERAIEEFQTALKIDPENQAARGNLELARRKSN